MKPSHESSLSQAMYVWLKICVQIVSDMNYNGCLHSMEWNMDWNVEWNVECNDGEMKSIQPPLYRSLLYIGYGTWPHLI